jgi:glutamate--cysteine ligase
MKSVCELLDQIKGTEKYTAAHDNLLARVIDAEKTPSARMLSEMEEKGEAFYAFAKRMSDQHNNYFQQLVLSKESNDFLEQQVRDSIARQQNIEENDSLSFDEFLKNYFKSDR